MKLEPTNPMHSALKATLIFEVIVVWLSLAGMLQLSDISLGIALGACTLVSVLAIAAVAGLKKGWGFPLAWLTQIGLILLGLLTPWMYAMGLIFALIWVTAMILGKRIEDRQKETQ